MPYDHSKNKEEIPDPIKASVEGCLPDWLQGTLVRIGPGMFSVGDTSYNHWFDGMALMHSFTFKDGDVFYRSKYLQGDTYKANMEANRIVVSEMGTMAYPHPSKNILSKVISFLSHTIPDFTDNCGNNIIKYGMDYYATSETNYIRKIDPNVLDTQDKVDYLKYLSVNLVTSHPHYDKEGNTYNMGTSVAEKGKTKYILFRVPPSAEDGAKATPALKNLEVLCTVPCRSLMNPSYYHSFGMTDNYFIFVEQPLKLDILKMATAYMRHVNWASCLKFCPEEYTLIHLIHRQTGKEVAKFFTDALVMYHHVNAFEKDGHVVFDAITYADNSLYEMFYLNILKLEVEKPGMSGKVFTKPQYKRFALPLLNDKEAKFGDDLVKLTFTTANVIKEKEDRLFCHPEILCEGVELPRINYDFNGKRHRYVYMTCTDMSAISTKVVKFDVEEKKALEWTEENCWPGEAVFTPRPNAEEEDDGAVLIVVIKLSSRVSAFLLVLDAKTFTEITRASLDVEMHIDMHGHFIPKQGS
ncbi:beta,beta-carotene 15,15'-dioxygenase isoform X1 [Paramormyrops kingsleyae]|uniref:beta,beta-carotene 15,15'-dioxygenase isoform X1 n=1 Tax=Paramormyrops kingsleyae TaxID=1676925 RepID=UPI003B96C0C5